MSFVSSFKSCYFFLVTFILLFSCTPSPSTENKDSNYHDYFDPKTMTTDLKNSGPLYINDSLKLKSSFRSGLYLSGSIYSNNQVISALHNAFKDFDLTRPDETSAQNIDEQNIYVASYKNLRYLEQIAESNAVNDLPTNTIVKSTYAGLEGQNSIYSLGGTGQINWTATGGFRYTASWAGNFTNNIIEFLLAMVEKGDKDPGDSRQITMNRNIYLKNDANTGNILLDIAYCVEHEWEGGGIYAPRLWLDGNMLSHAFKIKGGQYGWYKPSGQPISSVCISYIGSGANTNGDYMIVYILNTRWEGTNLSNPTTNTPGVNIIEGSGYYKIPAESELSNMLVLPVYQTLEDLLTNETDPKGYATNLQQLVPFTYQDLPKGAVSYSNNNSLYD